MCRCSRSELRLRVPLFVDPGVRGAQMRQGTSVSDVPTKPLKDGEPDTASH